MNKQVKRILSIALVMASMLLVTVFASAADVPTITTNVVGNGTVNVTEEGGKAIITVKPDKGHITASVRLGYRTLTGTTGSNGECVYTCNVPAQKTELNVTFRRARLVFGKSELAMSSGGIYRVCSYLTYTDGDIETRVPVANNGVTYTSSNPDVVSVNAKTGVLSAKKMGYARIEASAKAGNGVTGFFYVIVDGNKSPVVGTLQLNAFFSETQFVNNSNPGHSFLIFTNTSGEPITINTQNMYITRELTQKYYDAVNKYDGKGYDPVTFYHVTNGAMPNDGNEQAISNYREGFFREYRRGESQYYTVMPNEIVTIGNTGEDGIPEMLNDSDVQETLRRLGLEEEFNDLSNILDHADEPEFYVKLARLLTELGYDFTRGYNPINGHTEEGGVCVNYELYCQLKHRDYSTAACKTTITQLQLEAMIDFAQYDNHFNFLERNCTKFASDAWNLVTAAKPQYHMEPDMGGVTNALPTPMFLRNEILSSASKFKYDRNIEFYCGIGVIKPMKSACADGDHVFCDGNAKITKAGTHICSECGAAVKGATLTNLTLKLGRSYYEGALGVWSSSNKKVAMVSSSGLIIPISRGTTTITCRIRNTTYTCEVTVN